MKLNLSAFVVQLLAIVFFTSCKSNNYDLLITNASIFDSRSGEIIKNQSIYIKNGLIQQVTEASSSQENDKTINANGKLVTPGFIDVHTHTMDVFGQDAPELHPDSADFYRKKHANEYLPYGVTTVRVVGEPEKWLSTTLEWQRNPVSYAPDIFTSGGAIVTEEATRKTYDGHVAVRDSIDAVQKVQEYYDLGIRDIKLYWRLQYPELVAAFQHAQKLGMNICGHIDNMVVSKSKTLSVGLKHYEHAMTFGIEAIGVKEFNKIALKAWKDYNEPALGYYYAHQMEMFRAIGTENEIILNQLKEIKKLDGSITPTIHIFAMPAGLTYFSSEPHRVFDTREFTDEQIKRCKEGYQVMASYVKDMYDIGIRLNLGTDCPNGGKAALSELILLNQLGIPMNEVLKIATINSAESIGRDNLYGSIEEGKRANLIIFERNPILNAQNLTSNKIVIKDGKILEQNGI